MLDVVMWRGSESAVSDRGGSKGQDGVNVIVCSEAVIGDNVRRIEVI